MRKLSSARSDANPTSAALAQNKTPVHCRPIGNINALMSQTLSDKLMTVTASTGIVGKKGGSGRKCLKIDTGTLNV
jgi:hypothetical protein